MKYVALLWLLLCFTIAGAGQDLSKVRSLYENAPAAEKSCNELMNLLKNATVQNDVLLAGYRGAATMIMARHVFNPFSKLSYFKKGKSILTSALYKSPDNIELRILRLSIQKNAPAFLGYSQHVQTDASFLKEKKSQVTDPYLLRMINKLLT